MKYLGLDLGSRTLGMALSDSLGMIASSYDTFRFLDDDYEQAVLKTVEIIDKEHVECVVLGLPRHMNGDVGIRGHISEDFKKSLEEKTKVPVVLWDERLTTVAVNRVMLAADISRKKRKDKKDELAAALILQNYLDSKH